MVLTEVIGAELGAPSARNSKPFWLCPFHGDRNPSLTITPDGEHWKCFGCGASGDGIDFLRRRGATFQEAVARLGRSEEFGLDDSPSPRKRRPRAKPGPSLPSPPIKPPPEWESILGPHVEAAAALLGSGEGAKARAYLRARGLSDATIDAAGLGGRPEDGVADDAIKLWRGLWIPWRDADGRLIAVVVKRPKGRDPKYLAISGSKRSGWYPRRPPADLPIVAVEGELDALLLGQELAGLASVATLGSASGDPAKIPLEDMVPLQRCPRVYAAHDGDAAGEEAASAFARVVGGARRVAPPGAKDWTDARAAGVDLRAWWVALLAPPERPNDDIRTPPPPMLPTPALPPQPDRRQRQPDPPAWEEERPGVFYPADLDRRQREFLERIAGNP